MKITIKESNCSIPEMEISLTEIKGESIVKCVLFPHRDEPAVVIHCASITTLLSVVTLIQKPCCNSCREKFADMLADKCRDIELIHLTLKGGKE